MSSFDRNVPLSREDFAYESIKEAIVSGELMPNQKVSLTDLARKLGVSIIPVSSAVSRLASEGLIRQDPHHSPYVVEFSSRTVKELLVVRYHLEDLALREAVPNIGPEEIESLREHLHPMQEAALQKDPHRFGMLNRNFHMQIYAYGPFPMLCDMIRDLWNKAELNRCRSVFFLVPEMMVHSQEEHVELIDLIERKKADEAEELLKRHRFKSRTTLLEEMAKIGA
jgi:DNA-binding GntR family transcriptional regulator